MPLWLRPSTSPVLLGTSPWPHAWALTAPRLTSNSRSLLAGCLILKAAPPLWVCSAARLIWAPLTSKCQHRGSARRRKIQFLIEAASSRQTLALQEVHGDDAEMQTCLGRCLPSWRNFVSHCLQPGSGLPNPGCGGVAISASPHIHSITDHIDFHIIVPGRCIAALFYKD